MNRKDIKNVASAAEVVASLAVVIEYISTFLSSQQCQTRSIR